MQFPKDIIGLIYRYIFDYYNVINQKTLLNCTTSIKWKLAYRHTFFSHEPSHDNHNTEIGRLNIRDVYKRCIYYYEHWTLTNQVFSE